MAAKDKTRKQFPGTPSSIPTQSRGAMIKLVALVHHTIVMGRQVFHGVYRRRWTGHKQTNWITSRKTGRLMVGGHSRY